MRLLLLTGAVCAASACGGDDDVMAPTATVVVVDYASEAFYDVPFPDEAHRGADGFVDLSTFPLGTRVPFVLRLIDVAEQTPAFGTTSPLFFRASAALDPASVETSYDESVSDDAPVFVMRLDGDTAGTRHPVRVEYREDGGPWGAPHFVSMLPLQGVPLAPNTLYAAVVRTTVRDVTGASLAQAPALTALLAGETPTGLGPEALSVHQEALASLRAHGLADDDLAAVAVFRTADPIAELAHARDLALARPLPVVDGLALTEVFDDFCVYSGTTHMPDYQRGELPYDDGGAWDLTTDPIQAEARVVITVPRTPATVSATDPIPLVVFSRTGGGGDRPLVDRGLRAVAHGEPVEPGTGPAREFARVGWAAVSIDGPHGGARNPRAMDEQFLVFNVNNPIAMRDNVRQSALELILAAHVMDALPVDATECPDVAREVTFESRALMGHSMGATISPLAFALEPRFDALVLSGAGGSWIMNVVYKESPINVRPFAEALIGVLGHYALHEQDPLLGLLQWAGESADPPTYGAALPPGERDVLMLQGIVDTYILPPMANAMSLAFHLDLGGSALDETDPYLAQFAPLGMQLEFSGASQITLPASANLGVGTGVVVQHEKDGIEDGHEVVFQTEPPKQQYRCFLQTLLSADAPTVVAPGAACP